MATKLLPSIILLFALCLVTENLAQVCTSTSQSIACTIPVVFYDQAPDHMAHWRYPSNWWHVNNFYDYPLNGSCGSANNSMGWSNSDFELPLYILQNVPCCNSTAPIINGEMGLVGRVCKAVDGSDSTCGQLGIDRTPQYAYGSSRSPLGQVSSADSFYQFFHAVEQTVPVPYNLSLTPSPTDSRLRSFTDLAFFPLDGLGWNDYSSSIYQGVFEQHNYAFCMVMNTHFTYGGGEYFNFLGDDDVYAFIDGYLVMDLGGVHTALNASFTTNGLGMIVGTSHRFDFFYCERHTTSSEISFQTTISFFCPYVDWCGQCDGDGQSCCGNLCDDNNPCTTDKCDVYVAAPAGCHHTNVTCPPSTPCMNSYCNLTTGACTTSPVVCDDFNACTDNMCGAGGCYFPPRNCSSSNMCLITGCHPATGCTVQNQTCSNSNLCLASSCSPSVGCLTTNIPCQTFNACQTASCTPSGGCVISNNPPCNSHNACVNDFCDSVIGCYSVPKNITAVCGASDMCTQHSCDPVNGCQTTSTKCVSPDACHEAVCVSNTGCELVANTSCPSDACRTGACDKVHGGCVYTQNAPCPHKPCYNSTCDASLGCVYSATVCNTTANCTSATCVNDQCVLTAIKGTAACGPCNGATCSVSDPCNPQVCVNNSFCQTQPVTCEDYNACTHDSCYVSNGQAQCNHTYKVCNGGNACSPQTCDPSSGACVFNNNVTCANNNPCTTGTCVVLPGVNNYTCSFVLMQCPSEDPFCNPMECQGGVCVNGTRPDCSDGNTCTYDVCSNGTCSNPAVCPDSGTLCNPITCVNGACVTEPVNCTTGNLCATGTCDAKTGNCLYTAKDCNGTTCAPSSCDPTSGLCIVPPLLDCNDNNPCTLDELSCTETLGFVCNNSDITYQCNSHSACLLDFCNASAPVQSVAGACYHSNVSCVAPSTCMVATGCNATSGCVFSPKICPAAADWCQVSICDEIAGCITVPRTCAPADNYCYQGTCNNVTKTCGEQERPNWQVITGASGVTCLLIYSKPAVAGLTAGVIAAIVIAAVVAAAILAFAGKKGVDIFMASRGGPIGAAHTNVLYEEHAGSGTNPLHNPSP